MLTLQKALEAICSGLAGWTAQHSLTVEMLIRPLTNVFKQCVALMALNLF